MSKLARSIIRYFLIIFLLTSCTKSVRMKNLENTGSRELKEDQFSHENQSEADADTKNNNSPKEKEKEKEKEIKQLHLFPATSTIWKKTDIKVCWENRGAAPENERQWIIDALNETWSKYSDLNFHGWGKCKLFTSGIRIKISDSGPHVKALGRKIDGYPNGMVLNFTFKNWSPSCTASEEKRRFCIRAIAVHEFGHALGFAHEQNRDDRPDSCTDSPQGSNGDVYLGVWDLSSVMNYCNPIYSNAGILSDIDILGVRHYYSATHPEHDIKDYRFTFNLDIIRNDKKLTKDISIRQSEKLELKMSVSVDPVPISTKDVYIAIVDDQGNYRILQQDNTTYSLGEINKATPTFANWQPRDLNNKKLVTMSFLNDPYFKLEKRYSWYIIFTNPGKNILDTNYWLMSKQTPSFLLKPSNWQPDANELQLNLALFSQDKELTEATNIDLTTKIDLKATMDTSELVFNKKDIYLAIVDSEGNYRAFKKQLTDGGFILGDLNDPSPTPLAKDWLPTDIDRLQLFTMDFAADKYFKPGLTYEYYAILTEPGASVLKKENWFKIGKSLPISFKQ